VSRAADHLNTLQWTPINQLGWSKPRLLYELQNGLPYRTYPPGVEIDWRCGQLAQHSLDIAAGTVMVARGVNFADGESFFVLGPDTVTVGIEVGLSADVTEAPAAAVAPADASNAPASDRLLEPKEVFADLCRDNPRFLKERPTDYAKRIYGMMEAMSDRLRSYWTLETIERVLRGRK
jgi:hypothetical protein